jgi:Flp pilus assembly pilin Flp
MSAFWKIRFQLQSLMRLEEGQDLVEYALIIALVAISLVLSLHSLTNAVSSVFAKISSQLA